MFFCSVSIVFSFSMFARVTIRSRSVTSKPILFNPLGFDRLGSFAVFLSDNNLSLFILLCDTKLLLGIDPEPIRFQAFFFSHLIGFGLFTCRDGCNLPFLLFFRFCFLLIQLEYGLCCLDVLSFNFLLYSLKSGRLPRPVLQ